MEVEFTESETAVGNHDLDLPDETDFGNEDKTMFTFGPKKRELIVHQRIENDLIYFYEKDFNPCKFLWDIKSSSYEKLGECCKENTVRPTGRKSRRLTF